MSVNILFLASLLIVFPVALFGMGVREMRPPLEVVPLVDLNRYMGKWYEIARFPNRFEKGRVATTASYTLREDGKVDVVNECRLERFDGSLKKAKGTARVADETTKAKLRVTFFWPFYGDYWIIDLGGDYEYAVIGHPKRRYLWILSRTPAMDDTLYDRLRRTLLSKGYDVSHLLKTPQPKGS